MIKTRCCLALLAAVIAAPPAAAQRRLCFGPLLSTISIENGNAVATSYGGYGATLALLTGDYEETGSSSSATTTCPTTAAPARSRSWG